MGIGEKTVEKQVAKGIRLIAEYFYGGRAAASRRAAAPRPAAEHEMGMPSSREIEHIAAAWLARRDAGAWSAREQARLDAWLERLHRASGRVRPARRGMAPERSPESARRRRGQRHCAGARRVDAVVVSRFARGASPAGDRSIERCRGRTPCHNGHASECHQSIRPPAVQRSGHGARDCAMWLPPRRCC